MLCEICKKNPATIHLQEIRNGKKKEMHLCAECAAKKGGKLDMGSFNLGEVLFNLEKIAQSAAEERKDAAPNSTPRIVCPQCGWTVEKIRQSGGRLGCPACYHTFRELIQNAVSEVHRGRIHVGKHPGDPAERDAKAITALEIREIEQELKAAVAEENYERAALLRDRIKAQKEAVSSVKRGRR